MGSYPNQAEELGSELSQCRFESDRAHHAPVAQLAGGVCLKNRTVPVRIWPGAPTYPGVAQLAGGTRFKLGAVVGSNPSAGTIN